MTEVHKGHRKRLRERATAEGLDSFNPHQIMELLLFEALPRQDVSERAHALIERFGTVQGVLSASVEELASVPGIGKRTAEWLASIGELTEAYSRIEMEDRLTVKGLRSAIRFAMSEAEKVSFPSVWQLTTTRTGVAASFKRLSDSAEWYRPEVLKVAMSDILASHGGCVLIIVFDRQMDTEHLTEQAQAYASTLSLMNVELLDILITVGNGITSIRRTEGFEPRGNSRLTEGYLREPDDEAQN
ncbi:MAG: helix-hairpin-helix domain-containing protein [Clostridia bacterium]|nr:helix-hairpin-helix domain-containing protein [Clostridia bacterium]